MLRTIGFYVGLPDFATGHVRYPGNWGATVQKYGAGHIHFDREALMEKVRAEFYPLKPSRLESNFLCFRKEDADWYRKTYCGDQVIYDVLFDAENYAFHQAQLLCIPPLLNYSDLDAIHHYWKGDLGVSEIGGSEFQPWELVTTSPIKIVGRCAR